MKKIFVLVLFCFTLLISGLCSVSAYSGDTFETRTELPVYSYTVNYGYDTVYSDTDQDWFGIQQSVIDFLGYKVPLTGNNFETQYTKAAYDIFTVGTLDSYGELYNVNKQLVVPFPDFWNFYYKDVLGSLIESNYDSGEGQNFKITSRIDLTKDYAIKVKADDPGDTGYYYLKTSPHIDSSTFYTTPKSWIPYSTYSPSYDSQYYIDRIIWHTPQSASYIAELFRLAYEDSTLFTYLFQFGISTILGFAAGIVACGPASPYCGLAAAAAVGAAFTVYYYLQEQKAEQEYFQAVSVCDAYFRLISVNGVLRQVPFCEHGMTQVVTTSSFIGLQITNSTFYRFSATSGETIIGPKYLDGFFTYN